MKTKLLLILTVLIFTSSAKLGLYFSATSVKQDPIQEHLFNLQRISQLNGGNREARGTGYNASVTYVISELAKHSNYFSRPTEQHFTYPDSIELIPSEFEWQGNRQLIQEKDFYNMRRTGDANTGPRLLSRIPNGGCTDADFAGFQQGNIVWMEYNRNCFSASLLRAAKFGAQGVVYHIEDYFGGLTFREDKPLSIPVYIITEELNKEFLAASAAGDVFVRFKAQIKQLDVISKNLVAETRGGDPNKVIVIGAHLDSVPEGSGMNDNGSGSAGILAIAQAFAVRNIELKNKIRFIWFGAEEVGLLGAYHYVNTASRRTLRNIQVMINMDMIGSVNWVRYLHDGNSSPAPIREASVELQKVLERYFVQRDEPWDLIETGRSDHFAFIQAGVPSTILSSGFFVKTEAEYRKYGGQVGEPHDPCYHKLCDDLTNINGEIATNLAGAAANCAYAFAMKDLKQRSEGSIAKGKVGMTNEEYYEFQFKKRKVMKN